MVSKLDVNEAQRGVRVHAQDVVKEAVMSYARAVVSELIGSCMPVRRIELWIWARESNLSLGSLPSFVDKPRAVKLSVCVISCAWSCLTFPVTDEGGIQGVCI